MFRVTWLVRGRTRIVCLHATFALLTPCLRMLCLGFGITERQYTKATSFPRRPEEASLYSFESLQVFPYL